MKDKWGITILAILGLWLLSRKAEVAPGPPTAPPEEGFILKVVNAPSTYWRGLIRSDPEIDSGYLTPDQKWISPRLPPAWQEVKVWGLELIWNEEHSRWEYETVTSIRRFQIFKVGEYTYDFAADILY